MPVGSSLPILCLRRARPPSCESRVEPGFGVAAELGGGLALEPAANVGQRLARQRVAHCLFGLEHDRMDRAHAARRPPGRAVLEPSATPAHVLTVEPGFCPLCPTHQLEHPGARARPRARTTGAPRSKE